MKDSKTHYRRVFKSDHLGVADLEDFLEEGRQLVFTIKEVKQEIQVRVAGKKIDANIAYFNEPIKPLVLNSTNSKVVKTFNNGSPFVEDWKDTVVELYVDSNVKMKGEVVGGVRIRQVQPRVKKAKPAFTEKSFEKAKEAGASVKIIKTRYSITRAVELKYEEFCQ